MRGVSKQLPSSKTPGCGPPKLSGSAGRKRKLHQAQEDEAAAQRLRKLLNPGPKEKIADSSEDKGRHYDVIQTPKSNSDVLSASAKVEDSKLNNQNQKSPEQETEPEDPLKNQASEGVSHNAEKNGDTGDEIAMKHQPAAKEIPPFKTKDRVHHFLARWYDQYPWLNYKESSKVVVCFPCSEAQRKKLMTKNERPLSKLASGVGINNWKKAEGSFQKHQNSAFHKTCVIKLEALGTTPVCSQLSSAQRTSQEKAAKALRAIFKSVLYLGRQGLPLRGHDADRGNFVNLVKLMSEYVPELAVFLKRKKNYMSADIQNEMLKTAANLILRDLVKDIQDCSCFCIIVDETSDVSGLEQVSINVRIVRKDLTVDELFLGLYETSSTTGKSLFNLIIDSLKRFNLSINKVRAQCYDGGANMSAVRKGVQAEIIKIEPRALFIHCFNHSLNLALQDAAKAVPLVRDSLQWTHDVGVLVKSSPKRLNRFKELTSLTEEETQDEDLEEEMVDPVSGTKENPPKTKTSISIPRTLCPTRFTVRAVALKTLKNGYKPVLAMLEEVAESRDPAASKARGLYDQLLKSEIYFGITASYTIFEPCERLSVALQKSTATISGTIEAAEVTIVELKLLRSETMFEQLWTEMTEKQGSLELKPPTEPRKRQVPRRLEQSASASPNYNFDTAKDKLRAEYYAALDNLIEDVDSRFCQEGIKTCQRLEKSLLVDATDWESEIAETLTKYDVEVDLFCSQIGLLHNIIPDRKNVSELLSSFKQLKDETKCLFPEVVKVFKQLLVVASSSATAERSFSMLKRLKTYLRSTMSQDRLNHLAILHAYQERVDSIDVLTLMKEFVHNDYRVMTFGSIK